MISICCIFFITIAFYINSDGDGRLSLEEFKKISLMDAKLVECLLFVPAATDAGECFLSLSPSPVLSASCSLSLLFSAILQSRACEILVTVFPLVLALTAATALAVPKPRFTSAILFMMQLTTTITTVAITTLATTATGTTLTKTASTQIT